MPLAINARQLTKRYGGPHSRPALDRLDIEVSPGQLYGLIGPDGAGKTTAIRILTSVMPPTSGEAWVAGFDVVRQAEEIRRLIGYMPQVFSLYPDLSVIENLRFFAELHGVPRPQRERRIAEMLEFIRLAEFRSRRSEHLSGGMRKKLALACALVHDPQVLLLDEPTTGVDPLSRRELWRLLSEVVERGVTVLLSTPYMDEAERCQTVGILSEGRLLTSGSPAQLEAQLPFQVVEVRAKPRSRMREVVAAAEAVSSWRPVGDRLRLTVTDPEAVQASLALALQRAGAAVSILRQVRPSMEDVFVYLAEQRRGEA